jgi:anthranilate phosphoribosyltransferase
MSGRLWRLELTFVQLCHHLSGGTLTAGETAALFTDLMDGRYRFDEMAQILTLLAERGETEEDLFCAARVLRSRAVTIAAPPGTLDTCGTGGDGQGTFNISTAVAIVAAACGVPVAKHGNRSVSSRSGSADVLECLGLRLDITPEVAERCLHEARLTFLFAPRYHAAMQQVAAVRKSLGFRTIFNLLGPLLNPAGAEYQLLGVYSRRWLEPMALAARKLGVARIWVVHGADGLDEITTTAETDVAEFFNTVSVRRHTVSPDVAGLRRTTPEALKGGDARENAEALTRLLSGTPGPYRDIVLLNTAAALLVARRAATLAAGVTLAADAIDSGKARDTLRHVIDLTHA